MKDKILFRGWGGQVAPNMEETFWLFESDHSGTLSSLNLLHTQSSVLVSVREVVLMLSR